MTQLGIRSHFCVSNPVICHYLLHTTWWHSKGLPIPSINHALLFSRHLCVWFPPPATLFAFPTPLLYLLQVSNLKALFPEKKRAFPDSPKWLHFWNSYLFCVFMEYRCFSFHIHIINFNTLLSRVCIKTLLSHTLLYPQWLPQNKHSPNPCCISK